MARTLGCSLDVRRRAQWSRVIAVVLPLTVAACGAADPAKAHGVSAVQFQDVVVPTGLRLVDDAHRSYSRDEAGWRQAHFEYVGQTDVGAAANYVRERMPQHGWAKVSDETVEAATRMRFERGIYLADYTITRSEGATVMVVDYTTDYARR
jgi:hypothetical protein